MAQVLKRCQCPKSGWAKCPHSWTVRYWDGGKQRERSFKRNHAEAVKFSKRVEAEKLSVHRGDPAPPVTFADYAQGWLATSPGSPGTVRLYEQALRLYLLPEYGPRQLAAVAADREGVSTFLRGLSAGNAPVVYTALRALMREARHSGRVNVYRLDGIRLGTPEPPHFIFPTHAQLTFLAEAMPVELRAAVWIMRGTGVRPGEVLAVRGEGFQDGRLRITEAQRNDGSRGPLKARKPGEFRDIPVPGYVKDIVDGLEIKSGYLFSVPTRTFNKAFAEAAAAAGLEGFRPHGLRHNFASVALSAGVPVTDVARWLGHRNIQVTYRTYSHFIPSAWDSARTALDQEYAAWSRGKDAAA